MGFPKGYKGPGRPKLYPSEKGAKVMNQMDLLRHCNDLVNMGTAELSALMKDPNQPVIRVAVASILLHGIKKGDQAKIEMVLNRLVGKVRDVVDLTSSDGTMTPAKNIDVSKLSEEDLLKLKGILKKAINE
jgi:hypothetical protein